MVDAGVAHAENDKSASCSVSARRWVWALVILALALLVWTLVPVPASFVEAYYSRGVFRWIAHVVAGASAVVPFSLTLVSGFGVFMFLFWFFGVRLRRSVRSSLKPKRTYLLKASVAFAVVALSFYAWFLVFWGIGYRREHLEVRLGLAHADADTSARRACAEGLLNIVRHTSASRDLQRVSAAIEDISESMAEHVRQWEEGSPTLPTGVKTLPRGWLLSSGTSGVTSPFFLEPHVDGGLPPAAFVAVAAHELAHVAGYCTESDADLVAAIAGLSAADPFARYCVALWLFDEVSSGLDDAAEWRARLPSEAKEDLAAAREAARRYRLAWLARLQSRVYDSYLKSQRVSDGIESYRRGIELVVRAARAGVIDLAP